MKWDTNRIVSDAYRKLVYENKWLRKQVKRLERERRAPSFFADALAEAFKSEAPVTTATNTDNKASGDTCQCPRCVARRAVEKAVREANQDEPVNMASQPADTKAPNPYNEAEIIRLNRLVDEVRNRNTELEQRLQIATDKWSGFRITGEYQTDVAKVVERLFGGEARHSLDERVQRFLEEALELAQSCGFEPSKVRPILEWVYSRPKGPIDREVGGTMVTLAALCSRVGVSLPAAAQGELKRLENKEPEEMRGRHRAKPDAIKTVDRDRI